jgi:glycine cleavage system H lipoate-binding protein
MLGNKLEGEVVEVEFVGMDLSLGEGEVVEREEHMNRIKSSVNLEMLQSGWLCGR